jgi:hypothetical protein
VADESKTRWLPQVDVAALGHEESERFVRQRFARIAREAFATYGRGVLILHADNVQNLLRPEYNEMATDDGSATARQLRGLVESYDPQRQAVLLFRDPQRGIDVVSVIDIDVLH